MLKLPWMRLVGTVSLVVLFLIISFLMTRSNQAPIPDLKNLSFRSLGVSAQITFGTSGLSTDVTGTIVTIDDTDYGLTDLPISFWWDIGSSHAYAFSAIFDVDSGERYVLGSVDGLSTLPGDTIVISEPGSIIGHYKAQYYLTLTTNPVGVTSPSGSGWYDSGTLASISTTEFVDIISGSSRYGFNGWSTPDMSEITNASASPTTVLMDKAKTVTAKYAVQYFVTFSQSGVGSDASAGINENITLLRDVLLTVDGVNYTVWTVPVSFWWDQGSSHAFAFQSPMVVKLDPERGKKYVWFSTSGLSSQQTESFTLTTYGTITGNYKTQYRLTVSSPFGDPTPEGGLNWSDNWIEGGLIWLDSGSSVTASVTPLASGPTGTQYVCTGWTGTDSVPASGTGSSVTFTITSPSIITWTWKTQYYLTVRTVPTGVATILGQGWYDASSTVPLSAPSATGYDFQYWYVDGSPQDTSVASINVTMNAPRTAIALYSGAAPAPVGGRTTSLLRPTPTSLISIYVLIIASITAALVSIRRKRKR